jgi:tetratricopeptide (TPR) repeat protein
MSVRWLLPGIIFVFVCAGSTTLILKHYSSDSQPRATIPREAEGQKALHVPESTGTLTNLAVTKQPGAENHEDRVVALITEGNQLLAQGNYAGAALKFEEAVTISPDQEDLHYNLAIALAKQGKTQEAKKHYEEALRIFPDYAEAHNNLGNLLMNDNKLEEAISRFREAIKNAPENASFHNNLGTAFGRQGRVGEAIGEFEQAIKHSPTYVEARVNLANALLTTGRVEEAIAQLNEALRLKPDFKPALQAMQRARQRQDAKGIQK